MVNIVKSKLFKDTALYSAINILDKAVPFLIIPIIARILSKEEMGSYSLYQVTLQILIPILTLSIDYPIAVSYYRQSKDIFAEYLSTGVYLMLFFYSLFVVVFFFVRDQLSVLFGLDEKWLLITVIIVFLNFFNHLRLNLWRIIKKPVKYGFYSIPLTMTKNLMGLFFIFYFRTGWEGIILGHLIGQFIFCSIGICSLIKDELLKIKFEVGNIVDLLKTGCPVSVHKLSVWFSTSLNRVVINSILGTAATGSFGIGSTFGTIITILEDACNKAYGPYLYECLSKYNDVIGCKLVRLIKVYYFFFVSLGLSISFFGYMFVGIIFGDKYFDTREFIIPVAIASVINGLYKVHVNIILYTKKTYIVARNTIICALLNVGICYYLVSWYGILGAAYSSIIVQMILYMLTVYFSNKQYKLPWRTLF